MSAIKKKIGILGGSGMTGSELIRLILGHPKLELSFVHSRHHSGKPIGDVHSYLRGMTPLTFTGESPEKLAPTVDALFLALGHGEAIEMCEILKGYKGQIIDLTIDHRLSNEFVYGVTEIAKDKLVGAKRIANPGCFATSAILSAAPFIQSGLIEETLFYSSVTGSSGAGITPVATTHHPFRDSNLFAYKLFRHQHEPEIVRSVNSLKGNSFNVILTAQSGPFVRGIHSTLHFQSKDNVSAVKWSDMATQYYEGSSFVRVRDTPPSLKDVVGSNFFDLYVTSRGNDVIVVSVLDNLVKGAAGQAIQNLNVSNGWNEREGLWNPPIFP